MLVDGRILARSVLAKVKNKLDQYGRTPSIGIVCVDAHTVTKSYLSIKQKAADTIRCRVHIVTLDATASTHDCIEAVRNLQTDAIIVQLPLPAHINTQEVLNSVSIEKDVDVLSSKAREAFTNGNHDALIPPVAHAVLEILEQNNVTIQGADVVVVGEGYLVGLPVATILKRRGAHVITLNEQTFTDTIELLKTASIVVSGVGKAGLITKDLLGSGQVLIDAGTSESAGVIMGDFNPDCAIDAKLFTPVPGGVGPVAISCLFRNFVGGSTNY